MGLLFALLSQTAFAACQSYAAADLNGMSKDDLTAAYCSARHELEVQEVQLPTAPAGPANPQLSLPGSALVAKTLRGNPGVSACYDQISQMLRVLEQRKINVDAAIKSCGN